MVSVAMRDGIRFLMLVFPEFGGKGGR
jgi:hypothetical protein